MTDYLWSKFQQIRDIFGGERAQNPPPQKKGPFHGHLLPQKHLKIYNLTTANATPVFEITTNDQCLPVKCIKCPDIFL